MASDQLPSQAEILASTTFLSDPDSSDKVANLNYNLVAKYGPQVTLMEAETMQFVAKNSNVPVPEVHATSFDPITQQTFITMDFVPGSTLEALLPSLTQIEKDDIGS